MKKKYRLISFFSIIIITLALFSIILLMDADFNKSAIFKSFSLAYSEFAGNLFGSFSYLFTLAIIITNIFLMVPIKAGNKISIISGIFLILLLFETFTESFEFYNLNGGIIGVQLSSLFKNINSIIIAPLFFFWFFLSICLLSFPFKNYISKFILSVIKSKNKFKKENGYSDLNEKKIIKNTKKRYPWFSKVIFDDINKKVEIPIIPRNLLNKRKFLLVNSDEKQYEYEEVDTFSGLIIKNSQIDNNEHYEKIKTNWPEGWKNENINELETLKDENLEDENLEIEYQDDDIYQEEISEKTNNIIFSDNDLKMNEILKNKKNIESNDFQIKKNKINTGFIFPEKNILKSGENINPILFQAEQKESAVILEETLNEFGLKAIVKEIIHGPVVTLYKIVPAPGIRLQKIESLSNNLALRLAAKSIRIIAPIPGEKVVGIEIPNRKRILVNFKEIVNSEEFNETDFNIPIGLGKDIHGHIITIDLYKMPHILIAGTTGSGKSVCVNSIISSILFSKKPDDLKLLLIDPKIVELKPYNNIPHLLTPVITDPKDAIKALKYLLLEMEKRYSLFDEIGARDIVEYQIKKKKKIYLNHEELPFIVAIVDEFADLMSIAGKEAEILFARIAAKARAVGIHLVLATQRPSIDVITGLIKANIPARIAFQVISLQDSRIILDQKGAEKLLGQGDMLYLSPTQPFPIRIQGAFLSKDEVDRIAEHWKSIASPNYIDINEILNIAEEENDNFFDEENSNIDPLFQQAIDIVYETGKASASYLQRRLNIGYNRSARMVEEMEKMGIVGPQRGAKPREIISSKPQI